MAAENQCRFGSLDGSYSSLGNDDLNYSFNVDSFGTDFIENPVDAGSVIEILSSSDEESVHDTSSSSVINISAESLNVDFTDILTNIVDDNNNGEQKTHDPVPDVADICLLDNLDKAFDSIDDLCDVIAIKPNTAKTMTAQSKSDIITDAFNMAMQCTSPAPETVELDSDVVGLTAFMDSPNASMEKSTSLLSSPDSGFSDSDISVTLNTMKSNTSPTQGSHEKPTESYVELIARAIQNSNSGKVALSHIYDYILDNYPYFRTAKPAWRISVRHNLCTNECFVKQGRVPCSRGFWWAIHPLCKEEFSKPTFNWSQVRRQIQLLTMQHKIANKENAESTSPVTPTTAPASSVPRPKANKKSSAKSPKAAAVVKSTTTTAKRYHPYATSTTNSTTSSGYYQQPMVQMPSTSNAGYPTNYAQNYYGQFQHQQLNSYYYNGNQNSNGHYQNNGYSNGNYFQYGYNNGASGYNGYY